MHRSLMVALGLVGLNSCATAALAFPPATGLTKVSVVNTTGQDANDLHVEILNLNPDQFGGPIAYAGDKPGPSTFLNKSVNGEFVDFSGATAANGETVNISYGAKGEFVRLSNGPFDPDVLYQKFETGIVSHNFTLDGQNIGPGTTPNVVVRTTPTESGVGLEVLNLNGFNIAFVSTSLYAVSNKFFLPGQFDSDEALNSAQFFPDKLAPAGTIPAGGTETIGTLSYEFLNEVSGGVLYPGLPESSGLSSAALSAPFEPNYLTLDVLFLGPSNTFLGQFTGAVLLVPEPGSLALGVLSFLGAAGFVVRARRRYGVRSTAGLRK